MWCVILDNADKNAGLTVVVSTTDSQSKNVVCVVRLLRKWFLSKLSAYQFNCAAKSHVWQLWSTEAYLMIFYVRIITWKVATIMRLNHMHGNSAWFYKSVSDDILCKNHNLKSSPNCETESYTWQLWFYKSLSDDILCRPIIIITWKVAQLWD